MVNTTGEIEDEITYEEQTTDISYGRFPNGTGNFEIMTPTFNAENNSTTGVNDLDKDQLHLKASPNPTNSSFLLEMNWNGSNQKTVSIYNLSGKVMFQNTITENTTINVSQWNAGMYIVQVDQDYLRIAVY